MVLAYEISHQSADRITAAVTRFPSSHLCEAERESGQLSFPLRFCAGTWSKTKNGSETQATAIHIRQFSSIGTATLAEDRTKKSRDVLPGSLPPRGLSRAEAAAYVGISPSLFDMMIKDGRMPGPKRINSRVVWDRVKLDLAFDALPDEDTSLLNPWDEVAA
jgi:predicted DNA-binding transcriptional regulator AlpA